MFRKKLLKVCRLSRIRKLLLLKSLVSRIKRKGLSLTGDSFTLEIRIKLYPGTLFTLPLLMEFALDAP